MYQKQKKEVEEFCKKEGFAFKPYLILLSSGRVAPSPRRPDPP